MKNAKHDILNDSPELKTMPFAVPEGYFEQFKTEAHRPKAETVSLWNRLTPHLSIAAVFIFLVAAGTFILERSVLRQEMTQEDYILFSDNMMNTISHEIDEDVQFADAEINDDDIINYLIYSAITADEVELSK